MARPRVYHEQRVSTAIRLPVTLHGRLQRAAIERDVSVNYLVTRAVQDLLERLPPPAGADVDGRDR
jgi:predicted HicB family RNase H-like nuclease